MNHTAVIHRNGKLSPQRRANMASVDMTRTDDWGRVADAIRHRMNELGINQAEVTRRSGLSDHTARAFINGNPRGTPGNSVKAKLSSALGWTPDSIQRIYDGGEPEEATPRRAPDPAVLALMASLEDLRDRVAAESQQLAETSRRIAALLDAFDRRQERFDHQLDELSADVRRLAAQVLGRDSE